MSLEQLIQIAKQKGHRIVAVNDDFSAYCPEQHLIFPESDRFMQNPYAFGSYFNNSNSLKWVKKFSDPNFLADATFLSKWINLQGNEVAASTARLGLGICSQIRWLHTKLDLPPEVKPLGDPIQSEAQKWQKIVKEFYWSEHAVPLPVDCPIRTTSNPPSTVSCFSAKSANEKCRPTLLKK